MSKKSLNLIDIGCNLTSPRLMRNLMQVLNDAQAAGVQRQILTGTDTESNQEALALADKYSNLYSTVGFHPHHANNWQPYSHPAQHLAAAKHPKVVAIGEMGLDYFRNLAYPANQKKCFADQLEIAIQAEKPVFLHERQAFKDFIELLAPRLPELVGAVWHCFAADERALDWALENGLYIGITGWIADNERGKELRRIVSKIPDNRLMIETDAPYLTPKTLQPTPRLNEPQYLPEVLRVLAQAREQDYHMLAQLTTENAERFFGLEKQDF
ncbi:TatD family hydrolase [Suttonella ornithocola]|uniref:Deoxyribonuclease TatD n=1 Tax=Suttonella ornithocola TaxID=279832 RepID=A0A380MM22_9GAMM|nr:TatD family hydrolase [Suttonella ornithocola]SUO93116.1 Deoxyribonuclease TatD [Suttonella ornithocola]